jgi:hypothetical protein
LLITIAVYRFLIAPNRTAADYEAFGQLAGYYVTPATAGVATFFGALWVCRRLTSGFVTNGSLVGVAAVVLTGGLFFVARPEDRIMYGLSYVLRILGGYVGGLVVQRMSSRWPAIAPSWQKAARISFFKYCVPIAGGNRLAPETRPPNNYFHPGGRWTEDSPVNTNYRALQAAPGAAARIDTLAR